ncbi:transcription cofactor HES-6-like [Electrophorus electricus]|uniref:Transcription cofactor HES-6 n=1 Tax=Electrophorus electricus TaxID=8005 RepID=A0A4W4FLM4_ELEEL|nr:transcription cofactor HES-6-like [Electrophorus electricus]
MAPAARHGKNGFSPEEDEYVGIEGDRKTRKPLVEKKRRARINESLQELRNLLADAEMQAKMENAEVLELTVKRVENILRNRSQEADTMSREASERFAAGYIQCMHEVHTFVSTCPGIDAVVAAELLNHLLECMPLNEDHLQDMFLDLMSDPASCNGACPVGEVLSPVLSSPGGQSVPSLPAAFSPTSSTTSTEDFCSSSDLEETDSESSAPAEEGRNTAMITYSRTMWRPW